MIKIEGDKPVLYQWDLNRRVILTDIAFIKAGIDVHYSTSEVYNPKEECPMAPSYIEDGNMYADIPNKLLQKNGIVYVYLYVQNDDKAWTEHKTEILVLPRPKPANYVYTETQVWTVEQVVENALNEAKENGDFDGVTFTPSVSEDGKLSWTNDKGLPNPESVDIRGPEGPKGDTYVITENDYENIIRRLLNDMPQAEDLSR